MDKQDNSILALPIAFKIFKSLVIGKYYAAFISEYVKPKNGDRILDIGCGYGDILDYLPEVDYSGFDMNKRYIDAAIKRYGDKGHFFCGAIGSLILEQKQHFDIVMAIGILHHLEDDEVLDLFKFAKSVLKPNGIMVTIDPCYADKQSVLARYLFSNDRGKFIRSEEAYVSLASNLFKEIRLCKRHDLLRVPYTNIILQCRN
ncbi:MAG: class I SAM-dependent methyltransferase [Candidatus Omnitrophica bacterium]|nr:class I SAM-dependent methyltransferase [Candidatus Omnitrophota bacterium]